MFGLKLVSMFFSMNLAIDVDEQYEQQNQANPT